MIAIDFKVFWSLSLLFMVVNRSYCQQFEDDDLVLSSEERALLDQFKQNVQPNLPHDYMKEDIYLIRWLRASALDVKAAEKLLMENLEWRKENKMDSIIWEDWTDFEREYPYFLEGCDAQGRPVASAYIGEWDVRKAMISGHQEKMIRYSHKLLEEITFLVREAQKEGKNVTQFSILMNMNHFNLVQTVCPLCLSLYITMLNSYETHYPGSVHRVILVNTPAVFDYLLQSMLPFVPERTRRLLSVYGKNKDSWQGKLYAEIPREQLTIEFGGEKESGFDPEFLRKVMRLPC